MSIRLNGSTSGYAEIDAPAVAGSNTLVLPASNGSAGQLLKNGSTAGSLEFSSSVSIDSSNRLLVGTSSARDKFFGAIPLKVQIEGSDTTDCSFAITRNDATADSSKLILAHARGTSYQILSNNDAIGDISWQAADGNKFLQGAHIRAFVDGTPGVDDMPGRLVFSTTADGASSPTERMRIASTGRITLDVNTSTGGLFISNWSSGVGTSTVKYNTSTGQLTFDSSSRLVKEGITDCLYGIDAIKQLQPRIYTRRDGGELEIGFIADEMQAVIPELVPFGPKGTITGNAEDTEEIPIAVNYDKFVAVLTKALQEAITKIETLEAKVAALETA